MKTNALKGMKDILPAEQKLRDYVQGKILETYRASGFERISTPMLEDAENLLKMRLGNVEQIALATKLPIEQIQEIQKKYL